MKFDLSLKIIYLKLVMNLIMIILYILCINYQLNIKLLF